MRSFRRLSLVVALVIAGTLLAGAAASAFRAHVAKTTTMKFFAKSSGEAFTNSSGKRVSSPGPGDHLFGTVKLYPGTAKSHAATWTGSAFVYCAITKATSTSLLATCDGVVAVGGSMVTSISNQNLGAKTIVYPIDGGTGAWTHEKGGSVKTTAVGNTANDNLVLTVKT